MAEMQGRSTSRPKRRGVSELAKREERTALLLLLPSFLVLLLIAVYPLGQVFVQSFTNARFASSQATSFVGLRNYQNLLSLTLRELPPQRDDAGEIVRDDAGNVRYESWVRVLPREPNRYRSVAQFNLFGKRYVLGAISPDFVRAIWDTVSFSFLSVVLETVLGMIIALTLSAKFVGRGIMRAAMLVPWAIITVVSARIWEWILAPTRAGFMNTFLSQIGLGDGSIGFFTNAAFQLPSMVAMDVWKTTPFMALLLLAGLATIPSELYEAAAIDGASKVRQFLSVTLPLLLPTLAVALVFRTLDALRVFDIFQVVLGRQRYSMASFAQDALINNRDVGTSAAASVVIFLLILIFAILYIRMLGVDTE